MSEDLPKPLRRYLPKRRLGGGGMGDVYIASQQGNAGFSRDVALKLIRPAQAAMPRFMEMFLREGRALAALNHRGIVKIVEFDVEDGRPFLAMELLRGVDLVEIRTKIGALPWQAVAFIGAELASALSEAHTHVSEEAPHGLVHGDLSPANVMACVDGAVKVLDFGLVRPAGLELSSPDLRGKVPYLPLESFSGLPPDARVDVYALGVTLHELLTGEKLFRGANEVATMQRVMHDVVAPPSATVPEIPRALDEVILAAMARDRGRRIQTAAEVAARLEEILDGAFGPSDLAKLVKPLIPRGRTISGSSPKVEVVNELGGAAVEGATQTESASAPHPSPQPRPVGKAVALSALLLLALLSAGFLVWSETPATSHEPVVASVEPAPAVLAPVEAPRSETLELPEPTVHAAPAVKSPSKVQRRAPVPKKAPSSLPPGVLADPFATK